MKKMKRLNYYKRTGILPTKYNQGISVSKYLFNSVFDSSKGGGVFLMWNIF
jgi:hypothetical protein